MKESAAFIVKCQTWSPEHLILKKPELPDGFQENTFKGQVREGIHRACDQLVHSSLIG